MSTALALPNNFGPVSTIFASQSGDENLASGITGGFAVISYKGKVWSIRTGGSEVPLMRPDGDGPRASIEVVIVKSSPFISKVYYEKGYVPGSDEAPDCFSNNGTVPDPSVTKPQCDNCAACPMNAWGSRVNAQTGKQGKACADSKRLAVMPLDDLGNKSKIGPMLLRVPAASLQDTKNFAQAIKGWGYDYFTVGTRVSFDTQEAFPKFVYSAIRPLSDDEAKLCIQWRTSPEIDNILNAAEIAPKQPGSAQAPQFEQGTPGTTTGGNTTPPQDGTIAAQIAALQAQLAAKNASKPTEPPPPPVKTPEQLQIEQLQAMIAAQQKAAEPTPPPPPVKTPEQLQIEQLQAMIAAQQAQTVTPPPPPAKTEDQLKMEALQAQLAQMNATKEAEAKAAAEKEAEKERKKAERAAKKAADDAAKKAAEEANAETTQAVSTGQPDMAALQRQLAALQAAAAAGKPLEGEVIPPAAPTTPAPVAETALSPSSIEAKLAALMGKTA